MAHPLLAVAGPTAAGKSDLAVFLTHHLACKAEIVNCDSLQLYRGFDIGTAKQITPRIPHHLFDILDASETFSAGDYARRATAVIEEIASRGNTPIVVGGTGFYLRALIDGLAPTPLRNVDLRERLEQRESPRLHRILRRFDSMVAAKIHPNDKPKIVRAIEVCLESRRPMSHVWAEGRTALEGFSVVKFGLSPPRKELYARINERSRRMFELGLVDEVRGLLAAGIPETSKPFDALGYTEALAIIHGAMNLDQAIDSVQKRTRHYAKRQLTWFRRERDIHWLDGFGDDPNVQKQAVDMLR